MATAPFQPDIVPVRARHRGLKYLGRTLGARETSLFYHLVKRALIEGQWSAGTTKDQYLNDLRKAPRFPLARLAVYARRGGYVAATITPTAAVLPESRRGIDSLPELLVVYAADRGMMFSGYQISGPESAGIPEDARWLR